MDKEVMINTERLGRKEAAVRIIPLMVLALLFLIAGIALFHDLCTGISVATVIIQAAVAGFGEELIFRLIILGLCFKFLKDSRHFPAVIIVSILFGLAHFSNLMGGKFEFGMVLMQVVGAGIGGLIFGLMYYHTRSYLLCALSHFFYDLGVFFLSIGVGTLTLAGAADLVSEILIMVLCAVIAASYLNKSNNFLRIELIMGIILAVLITVLKVIAYTNLDDRPWDSPVVHTSVNTQSVPRGSETVPDEVAGRGIILRGVTAGDTSSPYRTDVEGPCIWYDRYSCDRNLYIVGSDEEFENFCERFSFFAVPYITDFKGMHDYDATYSSGYTWCQIFRTCLYTGDCSKGTINVGGETSVARNVYFDPTGRYILLDSTGVGC